MPLIPPVLDVVSLLSETQSPKQRGGGVILGVGDRRNSMLSQGGKHKMNDSYKVTRHRHNATAAGGAAERTKDLERAGSLRNGRDAWTQAQQRRP